MQILDSDLGFYLSQFLVLIFFAQGEKWFQPPPPFLLEQKRSRHWNRFSPCIKINIIIRCASSLYMLTVRELMVVFVALNILPYCSWWYNSNGIFWRKTYLYTGCTYAKELIISPWSTISCSFIDLCNVYDLNLYIYCHHDGKLMSELVRWKVYKC